jgi:hypothetical protein
MNGTLIVALAIIAGLSMLLVAVIAGLRFATSHAAQEGQPK